MPIIELMRRLAVTVMLILAFPASAVARAVPQSLVASNPRYQPIIDAALIPLPRGTVTIVEAPNGAPGFSGYYGGTDPNTNTIYLGPGGMIGKAQFAHPRHTLYHELGHILWGRADPVQRQSFQTIVHDGRPPLAVSDYGTSNPEERFAEAVALTAMYERIKQPFRGWYGFTVGSALTLRRLRQLMFQINGGKTDYDNIAAGGT